MSIEEVQRHVGTPFGTVIVTRTHRTATVTAGDNRARPFWLVFEVGTPKTLNIVPAVLLELPDREGVIKVQAPTAILLLIANTILMYPCVYRF